MSYVLIYLFTFILYCSLSLHHYIGTKQFRIFVQVINFIKVTKMKESLKSSCHKLLQAYSKNHFLR